MPHTPAAGGKALVYEVDAIKPSGTDDNQIHQALDQCLAHHHDDVFCLLRCHLPGETLTSLYKKTVGRRVIAGAPR